MSSTLEATKPDGIRLPTKMEIKRAGAPKKPKIQYKAINGIEKENRIEKKIVH